MLDGWEGVSASYRPSFSYSSPAHTPEGTSRL
jgi:hypothetical protein